MSVLIENEIKEKETIEIIEEGGVPICGGNLSTPVVDTVQYIREIQYKIGNRLYIENAD
jgi:hypothetical protein